MSVGFIIPLKAKKISNDWPFTCELLNKTLDSLRNQTNEQFHIVVVGHDKPHFSKENNAIADFLECSFDIPVKKEHTGEISHVSHISRIVDKVQKIAEGLVYLENAYRCTYYMGLDADDLLHKELVEYVMENKNPNGYLLNKGYEYHVNYAKVVYRDNMSEICGSTSLSHRDHIIIPELTDFKSVRALGIPFFESHQQIAATYSDKGAALKEVPFPAMIYKLGHGQNVSNEFRNGFVKGLKLILKLMLKGKPLKEKMRGDFAITE